MTATGSPRRYPTLDVLRLVAIGMTMLAHTPSVVQRVFFLRPFAHAYWAGVDLFMLISGWLLGGQLLREASAGPISPSRFYVKRWLRTLPPYYAMLAILYFGKGPEFAGPLPLAEVLKHVFFLQNYIPLNRYMVSWSLCVEEHFYLLLPGVVLLIGRRERLLALIGVVATVVVSALILRHVAFKANPTTLDIPYPSHLRSDGLWFGLAFAWLSIHRRDAWRAVGRFAGHLFVVGVVATLAVLHSVPAPPAWWCFVVAPTLVTIAMALAFIGCVHDESGLSRISFRGLQYMGELTFSIYLVHAVIPPEWLGERVGQAGLSSVARRIALVLGLSMLLHHVVERPALELRRRILAKWSRKAELTADARAASGG